MEIFFKGKTSIVAKRAPRSREGNDAVALGKKGAQVQTKGVPLLRALSMGPTDPETSIVSQHDQERGESIKKKSFQEDRREW